MKEEISKKNTYLEQVYNKCNRIKNKYKRNRWKCASKFYNCHLDTGNIFEPN